MAIVRVAVAACSAGAALGGCALPDEEPELGVQSAAAQLVTIDPRRSLVVTEQTILARFPLSRVMDQLVAQSGVPGLTSLGLFQQWWDTQNPAPGFTSGPHCGDEVNELGAPALNGFPYSCRPAPLLEGNEATVDPFADPGTNPQEYLPIGLFNRFDLAPFDGSNCGEYRIVYAKRTGVTNTRMRNLIIFEAALANPHPQQGLKGCKKIVDFWADLSANASLTDRAAKLEQFYFSGIPSVPAVIHVDHLGGGPAGTGQIRTNQFLHEQVTPRIWSLREFKLIRTCADGTCTAMEVVPVTVKNSPFVPLFDPFSTHPQAAAFQVALTGQVRALAADSVVDIDLKLPDTFNSGQSQALDDLDNNQVLSFGGEPSDFRTAIDTELAVLVSPLNANDIVARAQAMSCAGCHRLSNNAALGGTLSWPASQGFTHVSERNPEVVDGETRFTISGALTNHFLPRRKQVMEDYLNDKLKPPKPPKTDSDPIGGQRVH